MIPISKGQLERERALVEKIENIDAFHALLHALLKAERFNHALDEKETRLYRRMSRNMQRLFAGELDETVTCAWAGLVRDHIQERVHERLAEDPDFFYHADMDLQYVNGPGFEELVAEAGKYAREEASRHQREKPVTPQMVRVFARFFRDWFNGLPTVPAE